MKTDRKERKVFISFLGASNYSECQYLISGELSCPVRYVQEAMLNHYSQSGEWSQSDKAYILLTSIAREKNWKNDGHRDEDTGEVIKQQGLRDRLDACNLAMPVEPIDVLPGNNETEIMTIFTTLFNLLQEGDELFFDITHGFRYLPIIALVLGNYSKFLKNVKVEWIGYGNYEARDRESNIAQVVDLTTMSMLQDWTTAAADFINNGNAREMSQLTQRQRETQLSYHEEDDNIDDSNSITEMAKSLEAVVDDFKSCRGKNISNANSLKQLKKHIDDIEHQLNDLEKNNIPFSNPIVPLLSKIKDAIKDFDVDSEQNILQNGFVAAQWCIDNNMSQQAATILQETMISYICSQHDIDVNNEHKRLWASKAIGLINVLEKDWIVKGDKERNKIKEIIEKEPLIQNSEFLDSYKKLSNLRNDFNHCGMRKNAMNVKEIEEELRHSHQVLYNLLIK